MDKTEIIPDIKTEIKQPTPTPPNISTSNKNCRKVLIYSIIGSVFIGLIVGITLVILSKTQQSKLGTYKPTETSNVISKDTTTTMQEKVPETKDTTTTQEIVTETNNTTTTTQETVPETSNKISIPMIFVKGGTFTMGCTSEKGSDCDDNESPSHRVKVNNFYISKYEVTQKQWKAVMGNNPSYYFIGDDLPVVGVSWEDVQEFIQKLNAQTGKHYRLPTEAEWEYAARGGKQSKGYKYSGSNVIGNVAWYDDNCDSEIHPVGSKMPNELGVYDMSGNVMEWCNDWYGSYLSYAQSNPAGVKTGLYRVLRGGSWYNYAKYCRVSYRGYDYPDYRFYFIGFRLVCSH